MCSLNRDKYFCSKCGEFAPNMDSHRCNPQWEILAEEHDENPFSVRGLNELDAAEMWAYDNLVEEGKHRIKVRKKGDEDWRDVVVTLDPDTYENAVYFDAEYA